MSRGIDSFRFWETESADLQTRFSDFPLSSEDLSTSEQRKRPRSGARSAVSSVKPNQRVASPRAVRFYRGCLMCTVGRNCAQSAMFPLIASDAKSSDPNVNLPGLKAEILARLHVVARLLNTEYASTSRFGSDLGDFHSQCLVRVFKSYGYSMTPVLSKHRLFCLFSYLLPLTNLISPWYSFPFLDSRSRLKNCVLRHRDAFFVSLESPPGIPTYTISVSMRISTVWSVRKKFVLYLQVLSRLLEQVLVAKLLELSWFLGCHNKIHSCDEKYFRVSQREFIICFSLYSSYLLLFILASFSLNWLLLPLCVF